MAATYRSYAAANAFLSLLEVVAYVAVGLGGLALFVGTFGMGNQNPLPMPFAVVPGITILIAGFMILTLGQLSRATIHSAEIHWEILVIMREDRKALATSRTGSANQPTAQIQGNGLSASQTSMGRIRVVREVKVEDAQGKEHTVNILSNGGAQVFLAGGYRSFDSLDAAKAAIANNPG